MKNTKLHSNTIFFLLHIIPGAFWIMAGIGQILSAYTSSKTFYWISIALIFFSLILIALPAVFCQTDEPDEMFDYNLMKAKAKTLSIMHWVLCTIAVVGACTIAVFQKFEIPCEMTIVGFIEMSLGIKDIILSIVFRRLEAE